MSSNGNAYNNAQSAVLEAYGVTVCSDFPSGPAGQTYFSTYFSRPALYQGSSYHDRNAISPSWSINGPSSKWTAGNGPICGFGNSTTDSTGSSRRT